jgi:hypothetical protein
MILPVNAVLGASWRRFGAAFTTMRSKPVVSWRCLRLMAVLLVGTGPRSLVADAFRNLDFEQANTNSLSYNPGENVTIGPIGDLLPGWQVVVSRGPAWSSPVSISRFHEHAHIVDVQFRVFRQRECQRDRLQPICHSSEREIFAPDRAAIFQRECRAHPARGYANRRNVSPN